VRPFQPADVDTVADIFRRSTREVAAPHYTPKQIEAWVTGVPDPAKWLPYLIGFYTYLAIDEHGKTVAWIAMREDGYIDMLFALPEAVGRGAAAQLYDTVERIARELFIPRMTADASRLAEPFFMKRGWRVDKRDVDTRRGVEIPRAKMAKDLRELRTS
jgi:putative acetyltransferase